MDVKTAIETRRSIRKFENIPVEREKISQCLEAARLAPSACNAQPWHYSVIDDPQVKADFCKEAFDGIYKMSAWAANAPVIVAVVSDRGNFTSRMGNWFRKTEFYLVDQGISGEHFVLRAWELGLGTCWMGWFDAKKAAKFFNLPSSKKLEHLFIVGYPSPQALKDAPHGRRRLEEIVSYNEYKEKAF